MSEVLKPVDFESMNQPLTVSVKVGDEQVAVELAVNAVTTHPSHRFRAEPFSLILSGPRTPALTQGTYQVRHPALGTVELFVVPIGRDAQATRYEVVFN